MDQTQELQQEVQKLYNQVQTLLGVTEDYRQTVTALRNENVYLKQQLEEQQKKTQEAIEGIEPFEEVDYSEGEE